MTAEQRLKKIYPGAFSHGRYILLRRANGTCRILGKGPTQDSRRAWADFCVAMDQRDPCAASRREARHERTTKTVSESVVQTS